MAERAAAKKATPKKAAADTPEEPVALDAAPVLAEQAVTDPERAEELAETTPKTGQTTAAAARAAVVNAPPVMVARDTSLDAAPAPAGGASASDFVPNAQAAPAGRDMTLDAAPVSYVNPTGPEEGQNGS